jgi:3-hydroxypropanoate dehydrogenase
MSNSIPSDALDQIFRSARSNHSFSSQEVADETIQQLYALASLGPTAFNSQPGRFLFLKSKRAKERLSPALTAGNRSKTLAAPVTVVVAWDREFFTVLPKTYPTFDARGLFDQEPRRIEPAGLLNASLQAGYLFLAARSLGLDVGPMSGFDNAILDKEFFPDFRYKSLVLANIGYRGDISELSPRFPRLPFEQIAAIL